MKWYMLLISMAVSFNTWAVKFTSDVDPALQQQFIKDLDFVKTVQISQSTPMHTEIFGANGGNDYFQYFSGRVLTIGKSGCGDSNAVACVIPFLGSSTMYITDNFIKFSHPQIARLMVVFHEARHTERQNNYWPHATCPSPFVDEHGQEMKSIWTGAKLAGQPGCDSTSRGAYSSSVIMMKNIEKSCVNCTEKVKMDAGIYGNDQYKRVINVPAQNEMKKDLGI